MQQLSKGTLLHGGTYKIEQVLGQGSFGITYLAIHTALSKKVAIKEFFMKELNGRGEDGSITGMSDGSLSMDYARKFQKEALNLSRLDHPNIVRVTDSFADNGTYYYVMDYIEGENLNDYVKHNQISQKEAVDIICDVAKALMYMHEEKHMLHLDLKPGNVMRRSSDGHIFLIDFGLSKHYSSNGQPETSTTIGLGTPGYAPIEQANQAKNGEFRPTIDVYALGATFYKLLTRETPPAASELVSDEDLLLKQLQTHNVNPQLSDFVVHAMCPNVRKRTQTVRDFLSSLPGDITSKSIGTSYTDASTYSSYDEQTRFDNQFAREEVVVESTKEPTVERNRAFVESLGKKSPIQETCYPSSNAQISSKEEVLHNENESTFYDSNSELSNDEIRSKKRFKGFAILFVVAIMAAIVVFYYLGRDTKQERFCKAERILEGKVLGTKGKSVTDPVYLPADTLSALPVLKELAEDNYGPAMWYIAVFTANGLAGVNKDSVAAIEMYKKAAVQLSKEAQDGDMYAQCALSLMYSNGDGVAQNDKLAFNWMLKAAVQGYDDAQDNLALLYSDGIGVEENEVKAFEWWSKAAFQKHPGAMLAVGTAYMHGNGTTINKDSALTYYKELANKEYIPAYYPIADYYHSESDYVNAKTFYEKASDNSDWRGDFGLGMLYMNGFGVQANINTATYYLERAYTAWIASSSLDGLLIGLYSQLRLADCYYETKKYTKAFKLYKELAGAEPVDFMKDIVAESQYMVAVSYSRGNGCKQNYHLAENWRRKALANGYKER